MNLTLTRSPSLQSGTFGKIMNGTEKIADTLEPVTPKTPPNVYTVTKYLSPKFKHHVFLLHDVPGHTMIEMHSGNFADTDTEGCILLGDGVNKFADGRTGLTNSMATLMRLLKELPDEFTLTVK